MARNVMEVALFVTIRYIAVIVLVLGLNHYLRT